MNKEELFFNMYKDTVIISKKFKDNMKEKHGFNSREADDLFVKITNYQIKKYGERLTYIPDTVISKEEINRVTHSVNQRKYYRKNGYRG